ncbi:MAG: hypothetical protein AAF702_47035 [Chloroflexota bacterium]
MKRMKFMKKEGATETDVQGAYRIQALRSGRYQICFSGSYSRYKPSCPPATDYSNEAWKLTLGAGERVGNLNIRLWPASGPESIYLPAVVK